MIGLCILSAETESMSPKGGVLAKSVYLRFRPRAKTTATPLLVLFPKNTISLGVLWGPGRALPAHPRRNVGRHLQSCKTDAVYITPLPVWDGK